MSDKEKRYPTRMHEVLGVEPYEKFSVSSTTTWHGRWLFVDERGDLREEGVKPPFDRAAVFLVNHPECIIRKPRLTQEQVKQLKALVTLGFRWLIKNNDCSAYAYSYMPERMDEWWNGLNAEVQLFIDMPTGVLYNLVSWSDPEPLDIVATLKAAGVEVEE